MKQLSDYTGMTFGHLTVIGYIGQNPKKDRMWLCKCTCEREIVRTSRQVTPGKSCGCQRRLFAKTHGLSKSPEYKIWSAIKDRCSPHGDPYRIYYHRGIKMCDRWRNDFMAFYSDMGRKPAGNYSIDRIDNNQGYEPSNCRWATPIEQGSNTRKNVRYECFGRSQTLPQWSRELGISCSTLGNRLARGWTIERALSTRPREPLGIHKQFGESAV